MKSTDDAGWTWLASDGGPLLLVPGEYLSAWEGVGLPSGGRVIQAHFRWAGPDKPATDYDRACDVEGYLGQLEIGGGSGLVLGDQPAMTAWWPVTKNHSTAPDIVGYLVRWIAADSEEEMRAAAIAADQDKTVQWQNTGLSIRVSNQPIYLLDSAAPSSWLEDDDFLTIDLEPGVYEVATADHVPNPRTSMVLHRFSAIDL